MPLVVVHSAVFFEEEVDVIIIILYDKSNRLAIGYKVARRSRGSREFPVILRYTMVNFVTPEEILL